MKKLRPKKQFGIKWLRRSISNSNVVCIMEIILLMHDNKSKMVARLQVKENEIQR